MYRIISAAGIRRAGVLLALCGMGVWVLLCPQAVATGISRGLSVCAAVIIPSLLPFLVMCGVLTRTGVIDAVGRRCEWISRRLLGLPGCLFGAWVLGLLGGYLAGASAIAALYDGGRISASDARRALRISVCAGPGFLIAGVGSAMCGSVAFGAMLFAAHTAAALLIGITQRILIRRRLSSDNMKRPPVHPLPFSDALSGSVEEACRALLTGCGFVLLFSALLSLCDTVGLTARLPLLLPALLEVSDGCLAVTGARRFAALYLGMCVGWGGLSVHAQVAALTRRFSGVDGYFVAARILHGVLGGVLSAVLLYAIPLPLDVFRTFSQAVVESFSVSAATSLCMLLMSGMFLLVGRKKVTRIAKKG